MKNIPGNETFIFSGIREFNIRKCLISNNFRMRISSELHYCASSNSDTACNHLFPYPPYLCIPSQIDI